MYVSPFRDVVDLLQQRRVPVYLVTGGFLSYCETVAEALDVPKQNIFANKLLFYYNGESKFNYCMQFDLEIDWHICGLKCHDIQHQNKVLISSSDTYILL